ncbi:hypothetical protein DPMN_091109 [Dreissena polymorpha]|uniref:Uncharacterized protein n=1 Tax=Dreissena polymorpha TaxID=45954 RepID=A0A9D4QYY4_DREPO|nr:hypothetical protein DPMN_091109 [Dreissena polymorpha]
MNEHVPAQTAFHTETLATDAENERFFSSWGFICDCPETVSDEILYRRNGTGTSWLNCSSTCGLLYPRARCLSDSLRLLQKEQANKIFLSLKLFI